MKHQLLFTVATTALTATVVTVLLSTNPQQASAQGDLTPTAPPGPTGKTLTQIEPRTDINKL